MKIIKVSPTDDYFSLTWQITRRCNYDCHYCDSAWHDTTSALHSLEKLQQAWIEIFTKTKHINLPYKIAFTGGEVTINKNFLPFVSWLRENYSSSIFQLLTTTNGSASYDYYMRMFKHINNITFSIHSEHINEKVFFDTIIRLKQNLASDRFLQVAVMNEPWNYSRIQYYCKLLDQHQISYNVNQIDFTHQTRDTPIFRGELNLAI